MTTAAELADELLDMTVDVLTELESHHAPALELPPVFGGYLVGADARADLAFTLGLLHAEGVEKVAGVRGDDVALEIVRRLDGPTTHSFYSYRAAETLARLGGLDDNPRLAHWTADDIANVESAIDSTSMLSMLDDGTLPNNFAVVLTRCEIARRALGRLPDDNRLDELLDTLRGLFGGLPYGWWDDFGGANYDMYTPDVYLFAEPFADELGESWATGLRAVLGDLADVATPGGAVSWGRSTGALGVVMNVELGATAVGRDMSDDPGAWLGKAALAARALRDWFVDGVVTAHQHKMTMGYRGPERRLQMTLDLLGKLVQAVGELRRGADVEAASPAQSFGPVDRLVRFEDEREAAVWAHRGGGVDFVLPFVGGFWGDYAASPRLPGTFETPVDSNHHIGWLPLIHADGTVRSTQGPPASVAHEPNAVTVSFDRFSSFDLGAKEPANIAIDGTRRTRYRVERRSLVIEEELELDRDPATIDAISVSIPETTVRPLAVEFETDLPHTATVVDTAGMQKHRSFWHEHGRSHELVLEPARSLSYRCRVTPALRVASTAHGHWYDSSLWDPLGDRVTRHSSGWILEDPAAMSAFDVAHIHWPEWTSGPTPEAAERTIGKLREAGVTIFWTQHNRVPHRHQDAADMYAVWAANADVVVHHSEYGRAVMEREYTYGEHTRHAVIPHGHWGHMLEPLRPAGGKAEAEQACGMDAVPLRLGVVGAPRVQKDVQLVLDAVHASTRDDIELRVWSLDGETVPDDPRIIAEPYEMTDHAVYARRLHTLDALVMPFTEGMLTTGTMADAIGAGIPTLASSWGYLREALGDAAIYYGDAAEDLTACVDGLTEDRLAACRAAMPERQAALDWQPIAEATLALLDEVVAGG
ncbi:MAG: glycosyltransferase [Acidimicrobiales bacterium]|nr:glycosyltransferase [Acidimicrobiales bacterium]